MKKLQYTIAILLVLLISSCTNSNDKPNIILINIDDMGWKDVGFMGSEFYETPHIDLLVSDGMTFTNGYASAANCAPSRACLISGRWTPSHGIYTVNSSERGKSRDRMIIPTSNKTTLSDSINTLPGVLKLAGYRTAHAGKWHLSKNPLHYGFDINIGGSHAGHPRSYYPPYKNVALSSPKAEYLTDLIMGKAISFINNTKQPFFLYYSPYAIHTPIHGIDSLNYKFQEKLEFEGQKNVAYATMINNLDRNIGDLINQLKSNGIYKNTVIFFTSDNGGLYRVTKQKPLRAGKGSYYEGGIRVPFAVVWQEHIEAECYSDFPVSNLDIFPTIIEITGIADYPELDGMNILPVLQGKTPGDERNLFWHFPIYLEGGNAETGDVNFRTRPGSVIRKGSWKLHQYFEDNHVELYNLSDDIGETNNLIDAEPEKAEELLTLLKNWQIQNDAPIPASPNPDYVKE